MLTLRPCNHKVEGLNPVKLPTTVTMTRTVFYLLKNSHWSNYVTQLFQVSFFSLRFLYRSNGSPTSPTVSLTNKGSPTKDVFFKPPVIGSFVENHWSMKTGEPLWDLIKMNRYWSILGVGQVTTCLDRWLMGWDMNPIGLDQGHLNIIPFQFLEARRLGWSA